MWIYCESDIEIECESLGKWDVDPYFLVLKKCNIYKKITTKKGIPEIILNPAQVIAIGRERLEWHELQRVR